MQRLVATECVGSTRKDRLDLSCPFPIPPQNRTKPDVRPSGLGWVGPTLTFKAGSMIGHFQVQAIAAGPSPCGHPSACGHVCSETYFGQAVCLVGRVNSACLVGIVSVSEHWTSRWPTLPIPKTTSNRHRPTVAAGLLRQNKETLGQHHRADLSSNPHPYPYPRQHRPNPPHPNPIS